MSEPREHTGKWAKKPAYLQAMRCNGRDKHLFPLPLGEVENGVRDDEWIPCQIPGCEGKANPMGSLRHGYCGGCGQMTADDSPWGGKGGNEVMHFGGGHPYMHTDADFRAHRCPACKVRNAFQNTHCVTCGGTVEGADPTAKTAHTCDTCKSW